MNKVQICLSLKKGRPFGYIDGKVIHIYDPVVENEKLKDEKSFFSDALSSVESNNSQRTEMTIDEVENLYEKFINQYKYREDGLRKLKVLVQHLKLGKRPNDNDLKEMFDETKYTIDGCIGRSLELPEDDERKFSPYPNTEGRDVIYVAGCSGSGKSYWAAMYVRKFHELWPDKKIWMFSRKDSDITFDKYDLPLMRVTINEDMLDHPEEFKYTEFADSLVIFDDIDTFEPKIKQFLLNVLDDMLEVGRDQDIYILRMSHLINKGLETKSVLNESTSIVLFPHGSSFYAIDYVLKNYVGLEKSQILKIKNAPSRWVEIYKQYPMCVLTEKSCYLL